MRNTWVEEKVLLAKYLEEAAHVVDELSAGAPLETTPAYVFACSILSTAAIALTPRMLAYLAGLAAAALIAVYTRAGLRGWAALTLYTAVALTVVALPLLVYSPGAAAPFILRGVSSTSFLAAAMAALGWRGVVDAVASLGAEGLAVDLAVFLRYVPLFMREAASMLAAREARLVGRQRAFYAASTVVGGVFLRAYRRASAVYMAVKARSLGEGPGASLSRPKPADLIFALTATLLLAAAVSAPW